MSRRAKFHSMVAALTAIGAWILNWLILGETSPLSEYFLWDVGVPNAWRALIVVPGIISAVAGGNIHGGNELVFSVAFTIQWLIVGVLLSLVALLIRNKPEKPTSLFK